MHRSLLLAIVSLSCHFIIAQDSLDNFATNNVERYDPTWHSLDSRPLPKWYDEAKVGIFLHWGVFSVPSFGSEWFWAYWKGNSSAIVEFMSKNYPPGFAYQDFAKDFTAEFWNPAEWAELFASSGAKYIVLTSKHHEGYTLWPSKYSFSWNSQDVGPRRDLVGELAAAIRAKTDLKFGLYHSLFDWFHPLYLQDKKNNYTTQDFVHLKTMPELHELIENYKPEVIWSDGDWECSDTYWDSLKFLAWLYNDSPVKETVVVNDRWGKGIPCKHGDFYTCADHFNPGVLQPHKWENCMTVDKNSWGYRRNAKLSDFLTMEELLKELAETISCGGNILINVGPTKDGLIIPIFEERLRGLGSWLSVNGEAIYGSKPWKHQNDTLTSGVWYTMSGEKAVDKYVYAIVLNWPKDNILHLGAPSIAAKKSTVTLLGNDGQPLAWAPSKVGIDVTFSDLAHVKSKWAWVLRFTNVLN